MPRQEIEKQLRSLRRIECSDLEQSTQSNELSFGFNGHVFVTDDSQDESNFYFIEAWGGDAEVTYIVDVGGVPSVYSNITIPDGRFVYGRITGLEVITGEVLAYYI